MSKLRELTPNLVATWIKVEQDINGLSLTQAVKLLNKSLKSVYIPSRIYEWSRVTNEGVGRGSQLPVLVRIYMCNIVLFHVLETAGIRPSTLSKIDLAQVTKMLH
jgi:hypothetical protein